MHFPFLLLTLIFLSQIPLTTCYFTLTKQFNISLNQIDLEHISCGFDNQLLIPLKNGSVLQFDKVIYSVLGTVIGPQCFRYSHELPMEKRFILMTTPYHDKPIQANKLPGVLFRNDGNGFKNINIQFVDGVYLINGGVSEKQIALFLNNGSEPTYFYLIPISSIKSQTISLQNSMKVKMSDQFLQTFKLQQKSSPKSIPPAHPSLKSTNFRGFIGDVFGNFMIFYYDYPFVSFILYPNMEQVSVQLLDDTFDVQTIKYYNFQDASIFSSTKNQSKFYFYYSFLNQNSQLKTVRRYIRTNSYTLPKILVGKWETVKFQSLSTMWCQDRIFNIDKQKQCVSENGSCVINSIFLGYCDRQHSSFGGKSKIMLRQNAADKKNRIIFSLYEETRLNLIIFIIGMSVLGVLILSIVASFLYCHFKKGLSFKEFVTFKCCRKQKQNEQQKNQENQGTYNKIQN